MSSICNNQHINENKVMPHNYDSLDQTQASHGGFNNLLGHGKKI